MRPRHWFEGLADHLGRAYLRYSFTKGTAQEVAFLVDALRLRPGHRVLDVGCGPGRHARALAERGIEVVGIDVSERFVALAADGAPPGATFAVVDARDLAATAELPGPAGGPPVRMGSFDAAVSLCEGAFGLQGGPAAGAGGDPMPGDAEILAGMARAVRPGGTVVVGAFSAYFQVRHLDEAAAFDAATGVHHERTVLRDEQGTGAEHDLWTTTYTPRELRLMAERAGLAPRAVWSVEPGDYRADPPSLDRPEFLLVADRPGQGRC